MIENEEQKNYTLVPVHSWRIAEQVVNKYSIRSLIAIERSRKYDGKVYIFFAEPGLYDFVQKQIEQTRLKKEEIARFDAERHGAESIPEPEPEPVTDTLSSVVLDANNEPIIKSVDDSELIGEDDGQPKKRGRKKKVVEVEIDG